MRERTSNIVRQVSIGAAIALCAMVLCSCDKQASKPTHTSLEISGAGATFPKPLYDKWIMQYAKKNSNVKVGYASVGSGEGIRQFVKGTVDFGASDAAMTDAEMAKVERGAKLIPATAGIVVIAYNLPDLEGTLKLPRQVYADIFLGKIKQWTAPRIKKANPKLNLPDREIVVVARRDSSGTTFAFTNHLAAISKAWREEGPGATKLAAWPGNTMLVLGNEGVAGRIKISEGSIGYVEYGYAKRAGLPMAKLENKAGKFVEPSPAKGTSTLANTAPQMPANLRLFLPDPEGEDSFPIVTYSWIMLYGSYPDSKKGSAVKDFVKWGITEGQQYGGEYGYCPLPERVAKLGLKAIDEIK